MSKLPGGALATRPLHFIWIADCSGSMSSNGKIQSLNNAIKDAIPAMQDVSKENPNAEVLVRAIKFSDGAQWHISQSTPVADFKWKDLSTEGLTDMGKAMRLAAEQLDISKMGERALPPVLVLISDGQPTDDFHGGLKALMDQPWGKRSVRIAIAIGEDADLEVLQEFIGHQELKPLVAHNADQLVRYIRWVSTAVLKAASSPASQKAGDTAVGMNVPIPTIASSATPSSADDVW